MMKSSYKFRFQKYITLKIDVKLVLDDTPLM